MKLKLSEWASIGEILSSIAVVVTLIVLVLGIRDNTQEMRAASRQSLASRAEAYGLVRASAPELAQIIDSIEGGQQLSAGEEFMYRGFLTVILRNSEEAFLQYQEGRLSEDYFRQRLNAGASYFADSVACDAYAGWSTSDFFNTEFLERFDELVAGNCL